jgi:hypothetical protein
MLRSEAEEVREQLLELLDERQEAGPTSYVVQRTTVEPASDGDWMLEVVIRPSLLASPVELRFPELRTDTADSVTPEQLAWHVYRLLEDGAVRP